MVEIPDSLRSVFSATVRQRDGAYVIELPSGEIDHDVLTVNETYRVALFESPTSTDSPTEDPPQVGSESLPLGGSRRIPIIRDYFAAWDAGDPDAIATFFADDFRTSYTDWTGDEVRVESANVHDWIAGWLDVIVSY